MGCFNGTCAISHLPILGGNPVRLLLLRETPFHQECGPNGATTATDLYQPIGLPIQGIYDEYGGITAVPAGPTVTALLAYFTTTHGWQGSVSELLTWLRLAHPTAPPPPTAPTPELRYGYLFIREEIYQVCRGAVAQLPDYELPHGRRAPSAADCSGSAPL